MNLDQTKAHRSASSGWVDDPMTQPHRSHTPSDQATGGLFAALLLVDIGRMAKHGDGDVHHRNRSSSRLLLQQRQSGSFQVGVDCGCATPRASTRTRAGRRRRSLGHGPSTHRARLREGHVVLVAKHGAPPPPTARRRWWWPRCFAPEKRCRPPTTPLAMLATTTTAPAVHRTTNH
jgi:hypothetical protein